MIGKPNKKSIRLKMTILAPKVFEAIAAKFPNFWQKWGLNFLEAYIKNPSPLVSQESSPLTAANESWKNIDCAKVSITRL